MRTLLGHPSMSSPPSSRRVLGPALAALLGVACGGGDSGAPGGDGGPPVDGLLGPDGGAGGDASASGACAPGAPRPPLDETRTIVFQGVERSYELHVPASYAGAPTALVLNFHGYTSEPAEQELLSQMTPKSDEAGFIVAYPRGLDESWNAGACCQADTTVDDVGFVAAVIDDIAEVACIDPKRIFATGMSNGGFLSHRLACELSDRIAAIAPVAGVIGIHTCTPPRPVPVMHFHGTWDTLVPWNGDPSKDFPSVPATIEGWKTRNGCTGPPVETYAEGDSRCDTYASCAGGVEVTLCKVDRGGHTWPGGTPVPILGHTTQDISATDEMWEFFQRHPMP